MPEDLQPCPYCGASPAPATTPDDLHYLECSNRIDCFVWPITNSYPTPELAAAAWQNFIWK